MRLGKKVKKEISEHMFFVYLFIALLLAIFTLFNAYIFWPREAELGEFSIELVNPIISAQDIVPVATKIEASAFPVYKELVAQVYGEEITLESNSEAILSLNEVDYEISIIPDRYNAAILKDNILSILGNDPQNYGVYFYDLNRNIVIGINDSVIFPPMSISKLPVAVMMLREIDKGNFGLYDQFVFDSASRADPTNVLKQNYIGTSFALIDYLRFLIIDSDNASIRKLENIMGGYQVVNEKVKSELGVQHFFRDPHDATAKDVGKVFAGIYNQTFLSSESNAYILELLQNTHWSLQDGIPVGVPEPYKYQIAHKTGQGSSNPGFIWEDAGIVYGIHSDYVLVILNDFIDIPTARYKIQHISSLIWETTQEL